MDRSVSCKGIVCPFIRENDDLVKIVVDSVLDSGLNLQDKDIIGITESVVARNQGNYVTVDEVAEETKRIFGPDATIVLYNPIYSRNRFAMILKGIARGAKKLILIMPWKDEVGNVRYNHPFTGLNYDEYYKEIVESENCECIICEGIIFDDGEKSLMQYTIKHPKEINGYLDCTLHNERLSDLKIEFKYDPVYTLYDYFPDKCEYGLLGSNKATEEKLKLFPSKNGAQKVCDKIKSEIKKKTEKDVIVCVYGDGAFHDPVGGIWEFADPITMPAYTDDELIESTPNEIKLKALIDNSESDYEVEKELSKDRNNLKGNMKSQGTTPRLYRDLLASLMDLVSGSGDRATPVVVIQNYF